MDCNRGKGGGREAGQEAAGAGLGNGDWGVKGREEPFHGIGGSLHYGRVLMVKMCPCDDIWAFCLLPASLAQGQDGHSRWMDLPKQRLGIKREQRLGGQGARMAAGEAARMIQ